MEEWKPITGYEGLYEVSNLARIKSLARFSISRDGRKPRFMNEMIMKPGLNSKKYYITVLRKDGIGKCILVHRIMAIEFLPNPEKKECINHKDGNRSNNSLENLEWCTQGENQKHAYATGLASRNRKRPNKVLYPDVIKAIQESNLHYKELCKIYNIHSSTVFNARRKSI